ncbi:MAG: glutamine--fructose-6-phosphate transaminase (isomerizing) [Anaerolineales bacterium]|nr:MAG: glutamine--fructose-6-phosphate transaminase (isomerizing) [Anaerolineales bacterium]
MCGIVGYVGPRDATPIIYDGLKRLEYRGYDSAGIAVIEDGEIKIRRDAGKLNRLGELLLNDPINGQIGIGHTRWATHGEPSARNAHPHVGESGRVVIVHNGIVENFLALRDELTAEGASFSSDTDTEIIVLLVERYMAMGHDLTESARRAISNLDGAHGIVLLSIDEPDKIVAARVGNAGGVVLGIGEGEMFIASDIPAILEHTRIMAFLEAEQMAVVTASGFKTMTLEGDEVSLEIMNVPWDPVSAEKGEYKHFMLKEIFEQVRSTTDTIAGRVDFKEGQINLHQLNLTSELVQRIDKIIITACGTAAHAGMVGRHLIERIARIPVQVEIASEFRYQDPLVDVNTVVLAISQSGETADTLAAMKEGRDRGATLWSIVNAIGSQAMRIADGYISMQTGPEIGVASTKAFTAPLIDLYMLAIQLGDMRGTLDETRRRELVRDLRCIPDLVGQCLDRADDIEKVAWELKEAEHCLYLGRGINMPIAYEGALKIKEISYIHAEAYPAGEMKHGPIALIDEDMPVIAIAPKDPWYEKMLSQIEQTKARGGNVIAVATDGDELLQEIADHMLWVPETPWLLSPVTTIIPLQLLAYHTGVLRGADVDQPRNLAKSVTVE